MQDTYSKMLITTSSSIPNFEDRFDDFVIKKRRRAKGINTDILRRRLSALATCLCVTLALSSLLFTGIDAADKMLFKGGVMEFIITDVFGMESEYGASNFTELMMEQSFWGNINKSFADKNVNTSKKYPLPAFSRLHLPIEEGVKPVIATPKDPEPDETKYTLEQLYAFDPSKVPSGHLPIIPRDMSHEYDGKLKLSNETKYTPNLAAIAESNNTVPRLSSDERGKQRTLDFNHSYPRDRVLFGGRKRLIQQRLQYPPLL